MVEFYLNRSIGSISPTERGWISSFIRTDRMVKCSKTIYDHQEMGYGAEVGVNLLSSESRFDLKKQKTTAKWRDLIVP